MPIFSPVAGLMLVNMISSIFLVLRTYETPLSSLSQKSGPRYNRNLILQPVQQTVFYHFAASVMIRSEEHTSELQSLMRISYAVFCLKNKNNEKIITTYIL